MTPYTYSARVERIIDGDTIDLTCDVGFRIYHKARFRLYGIDTPERGAAGWAEATAHLASLLPIGTYVTVRSYRPDAHPKADSFGRWLVEIFAGEVNVNQAMISDGHAVEYSR